MCFVIFDYSHILSNHLLSLSCMFSNLFVLCSVCLPLHHTQQQLVWICHKTGQEQTARDSQPGLKHHAESCSRQEHQCRPITPCTESTVRTVDIHTVHIIIHPIYIHSIFIYFSLFVMFTAYRF